MKNLGVVFVLFVIAALISGLVYFDIKFDAISTLVGSHETIGQVPPKELGNFFFYGFFLVMFIKWTVDVTWSVGEAIFSAVKDDKN